MKKPKRRIHLYVPTGRVTVVRGERRRVYAPSVHSAIRLAETVNELAKRGRFVVKAGCHGWLAVEL